MLLARYAPVGSQRYEKLVQSIKSFDKIMEWIPAQLFAIWSIFVAGMATGKAQIDRFYFWDWSDWLIGTIVLVVIVIIFSLTKTKFRIKDLSEIDFNKNTVSGSFYIITFIILFLLGGVVVAQSDFLKLLNAIIPYILFVIVVGSIFSIKTTDSYSIDQKSKTLNAWIGVILLLAGIVIGFKNDDPTISTTALVSLPFVVVLLFSKHVRHLERAKFYPIFIYAMFVVSREGWFLIPLLMLFFILRSYNYLRYQKVYPTFGVTDDRS